MRFQVSIYPAVVGYFLSIKNVIAGAKESPQLPGILPGEGATKIIIAGDIDYPPYSYLGPASEDFPLVGFAVDFLYGLTEVCDIEPYVVQTDWNNCWRGDDKIGAGLAMAEFHGCYSYTHTKGVRNRYLEFTSPIINGKPAGILTRLNADGKPVIDGDSDLDGVAVVDVQGWAPTADTLAVVVNPCTGEKFSGYTMIAPTVTDGTPNDNALKTLLKGDADAMWVYADQAFAYSCDRVPEGVTPEHDCDLWDGLGTDFAYIQTGMYDHQYAGTTLAISKKGSGLANILDPCIEKFLEKEEYYNLCVEYDIADTCFPNKHFPDDEAFVKPPSLKPTNELFTKCSSGYCSCPGVTPFPTQPPTFAPTTFPSLDPSTAPTPTSSAAPTPKATTYPSSEPSPAPTPTSSASPTLKATTAPTP